MSGLGFGSSAAVLDQDVIIDRLAHRPSPQELIMSSQQQQLLHMQVC
jgi:hypothetical protein